MFTIEFFSFRFGEFKQFKICDGELLFCFWDDFTNIDVSIGFNHTICSKWLIKLPVSLYIFTYKRLSSELISKVNNFKLSIIADNDIANVQILNRNIWIYDLFQKDFLVLDIILHINQNLPFLFVYQVNNKWNKIVSRLKLLDRTIRR